MRSLLFLTLLGLLAISACRPAAAPVSISNRPASINDVNLPKPLNEMSWTLFDGNGQKLGDLRGKVVILDFWATFCPPCIDEIPHLKSLQAKYGSDVQVIGLHVGGEEDRPNVPEFVSRLGVTYSLAYPEDALTSAILGNDSRIPQTAVIGRDGKMISKIVGFDASIRDELDKTIALAVEARE
jgi:thiol-disulfide isomerase/thioredoxin